MRIRYFMGVAGVIFLVALLCKFLENRDDVPPGLTRRLNAKLISHDPDGSGPVEVSGQEVVPCRWEIRNISTEVITGMVVAANCQCQVRQAPPDVLQPGQTANVIVNVSPPNAGTAKRTIPIFANGTSDPVGILSIQLTVPVSPPSWIVKPTAIEMRSVAGQNVAQEWLWESVERGRAPRWIDDVTVENDHVLKAEVHVSERPWGEEGELSLRSYRVRLCPIANSAQLHRTALVLHEAESERRQIVPVSLEVLPAVSVIPATISLIGNESQQVTVVRRVAAVDAIRPSFDAELINVVPINASSNGAARFPVTPCINVTQATETEVVFRCTDVEFATAIVRMAPRQ